MLPRSPFDIDFSPLSKNTPAEFLKSIFNQAHMEMHPIRENLILNNQDNYEARLWKLLSLTLFESQQAELMKIISSLDLNDEITSQVDIINDPGIFRFRMKDATQKRLLFDQAYIMACCIEGGFPLPMSLNESLRDFLMSKWNLLRCYCFLKDLEQSRFEKALDRTFVEGRIVREEFWQDFLMIASVDALRAECIAVRVVSEDILNLKPPKKLDSMTDVFTALLKHMLRVQIKILKNFESHAMCGRGIFMNSASNRLSRLQRKKQTIVPKKNDHEA